MLSGFRSRGDHLDRYFRLREQLRWASPGPRGGGHRWDGPHGPGPHGACGPHRPCGGRIERFIEPALLLLLREQPSHGYELMDRLSAFYAGDTPDAGTVYRNLRRLEEEQAVTSSWETGGPGPARRLYQLTAEGQELLDAWAVGIKRNKEDLERFLSRYEKVHEDKR